MADSGSDMNDCPEAQLDQATSFLKLQHLDFIAGLALRVAEEAGGGHQKWARPAYEQGALPTLSLLPGEVSVRVLPGDKMYQAMTIEPVSLSWPNLAGCRWLRLSLGHKNGSPNGCIPISFQWLV